MTQVKVNIIHCYIYRQLFEYSHKYFSNYNNLLVKIQEICNYIKSPISIQNPIMLLEIIEWKNETIVGAGVGLDCVVIPERD